MPYTVPNQRVIHINREPLGGSFLGINNENWKDAARVMGAHAFLLYIYLASNKNSFDLALSPAAIQKEIGMPPSTFRDQLKKLESLGYLVPGDGNKIDFYEVPHRATHSDSARGPLNSTEEKSTAAALPSTAHAYQRAAEDIEIYINNKEKIINNPGGVNESALLTTTDNKKGFVF